MSLSWSFKTFLAGVGCIAAAKILDSYSTNNEGNDEDDNVIPTPNQNLDIGLNQALTEAFEKLDNQVEIMVDCPHCGGWVDCTTNGRWVCPHCSREFVTQG
jgi:hypothetical protein